MKNAPESIKQVLLYMLILFCADLQAQDKSDTSFILTGNISGAEDGEKVKLVDIEGQRIIDSAVIRNSAFVLKGHVAEPSSCWILCNDEYAVIQVENVPMTFSSTLKNMQLNYVTHGGREQSLQNELNHLQRSYESIYTSAYDSLNKKLYSNAAQKARLIKIFNEAQDTYMDIYVDYGRKHIDSYLGLDIVYRNRKRIPKDSIILLYNSLPESLKGTARAKSLKLYANEKLAQIGEQFLDFEAYSMHGRLFKLSDLKGKYIYLTFGSFTCGPCRAENKEIAKIYGTLNNQIDIVNFSLDVNRKEWEAATKEDGIIWYNVSDMMGMAGKTKTLYNVQAMPTSFLIDPKGVIIERFDGYSDENIKKIVSIVSKKNS